MRQLDRMVGICRSEWSRHCCLVTTRSVHLRCSGVLVPCIWAIGGRIFCSIFSLRRLAIRAQLSNPCLVDGAGLSSLGASGYPRL